MSHSASNQSTEVSRLLSRQWTPSCIARSSFFQDLLPVMTFFTVWLFKLRQPQQQGRNLSQLCLSSNYSRDLCAVTAPLRHSPGSWFLLRDGAWHCLSEYPAGPSCCFPGYLYLSEFHPDLGKMNFSLSCTFLAPGYPATMKIQTSG